MIETSPEAAPLHADVAEGPPGGRAVWTRAADGTRIRVALWPAAEPRGTVLMFPGRTEYIEKYGRLAGEITAAGYAMAAIDWRGQGLSDRPRHQRDMGHVLTFAEYQEDVAAAVSALGCMAGAPRPWHLIAHSMGGAIGLRALHEGLDVAGVAFSAPMWGIAMTSMGRVAAGVLRRISRPFRLGTRFTPSTGPAAPLMFEGNRLTTDRDQFAYMEAQVARYPELALGGPSVRWLEEALHETADLMELPPPDRRVLTFLGTEEKIVASSVVRRRMETWPRGELVMVEGAEHEVLMEAPAIRGPVVARILQEFDAA